MKTYEIWKSLKIANMRLPAWLFITLASFLPHALADKPLVGAFYYPWFRDTGYHWDNIKQMPALGLYDSRDSNVMNQHMAWADQAGLSFFLLSYWREESDFSIYEMFNRADATTFKLGILLEPDPEITAIKNHFYVGQTSWNTYMNDSANWFIRRYDEITLGHQWFSRPSYLKDGNGKKIFSFFQWDTSGQVCEIIRRVFQARPDIPSSTAIWYFGSQGNDIRDIHMLLYPDLGHWARYVPIIGNGWGGAVSQYSYFNITMQTMQQRMITVSPSFDNTNLGVSPVSVVPRDSGARLLQQLNDIKTFSPFAHYVVVTSFNEWQEDSTIEPSLAEGTLYLDTIRAWLDSW